MRKDTLSENLTKLNTLLVKAVQVPYKALEHDLILKVSKKSTKGGRCKLITDDNAGWTFALEVLIQVLIFFAAGKCNDLSSNIGAKLLLAGAVLNVNIYSKLALLKADELKRNDIRALMEQLIEGMLSVGSWLTEDNRTGYIAYRLTEAVYGFTIGFHITLLKMCRETA